MIKVPLQKQNEHDLNYAAMLTNAFSGVEPVTKERVEKSKKKGTKWLSKPASQMPTIYFLAKYFKLYMVSHICMHTLRMCIVCTP